MGKDKRALVVSHACAVPANQSVFAFLVDTGWKLDLVVPHSWTHEYADDKIPALKLPELNAGFHPSRVAFRGKPQRHVYAGGCTSLLRKLKPAIVFLEEESYSIPAFQWGVACWRRGIPFGVQAAENLDRPLPLPARLCRSWTLAHAAFVAARSPTAKKLAEQWGTQGPVEVIPHAVPAWPEQLTKPRGETFTIGYAGRLVEEKGLFDLVAAAHCLGGPVRVLLAGNGPLKEELASAGRGDVEVDVASDFKHEEMAEAFRAMDVFVLPSRTTETWVEQFGRVLVEALWCGVPVVGSSSGEIPWVIGATGGGVVFPEGDVRALSATLEDLRSSPDKCAQMAARGRESVERLFSVEAAGRRLDAVLEMAVGQWTADLPRDREPDSQNHRFESVCGRLE